METEKKNKVITFSITMKYDNFTLSKHDNTLEDLREFIRELSAFMYRMEKYEIAIPDNIAQKILEKSYSNSLNNVTITTEEV